MRRQLTRVILASLLACLGALGCDFLDRDAPRPQATPLDALTQWPGHLRPPGSYAPESVRILQQWALGNDLLLFYRWQAPGSTPADPFCLSTTFVTREKRGWLAQATSGPTGQGNLDTSSSSPRWNCDINEGSFHAWVHRGGNLRPVTAAFGLAPRGEFVRITWEDQVLVETRILNRSFLMARPESLGVLRVELLDADGGILQTEEFVWE